MRVSVVCFMLAVAASAVAADGPTLAGKWRVHTSVAGRDSDQTCTFVEDNGKLSGSCGSDQGSVEISGRFDQTTVSWSYKSDDEDGGSSTVRYDGRLDSGRITGTVTISESGSQGDFMAMPATN